MKNQLFLTPLVSLILVSISFGQQSEKSKTELVFNNNLPLNKKIDSLFKSLNYQTPGIAVSVFQNGKLIAKKAYGMASIEHQISFSHHSPVRLGYSGGREFMCAGLALMEADGLLRFDDKLKKYFPKLPVWSDKVTIQDLLNHSSGFDDEWATMLLMQAHMDNRVDKEQLLTMLYNQPKPQVVPGKGYMYSNSDFALLRFIMELASKKKLPDYLQQKLFVPLGMAATFMNDDLGQIIPGLADRYYYHGIGNYMKDVGVKSSPGGNYRMVTTAADLEKWAMALEDSNSVAAKAIRRLYQNARPIPVLSPEVHYVFGHEWQKIENIGVIKHGGVNADFYMTRIPSQGIIIIGLGNEFQNMTAAMNLADSILNKKAVPKQSPPPISTSPFKINKNDLAKYAGRYFQQIPVGHSSHLRNIRFFDIKLGSDSLHFYFTPEDYFTMLPVGEGLFKDPDFGTIIQIAPAKKDSVMSMQAWPPDGSLISFVKTKADPVITKAYLEQFMGRYHSKHLDFYCRIVLNENNQPVIRRPTISDKILIPDGLNRFLFLMEAGSDSWYVVAQFTKNEQGKVDGMNLQHVRMMHHRFDKQ